MADSDITKYSISSDEISQAIKDVALGKAKRVHEVQERIDDDGAGNKIRTVKEAHVDPPNISLLLKLSEERIGGPQDYC